MKQHMPDRNLVMKKYSLEEERKETETILSQQNATKWWITRKKKKELELLRNKSQK